MIVRARRAWVAWSLLAAIAGIHVLQRAGVDLDWLALQPAAFAPWQLLSYALVHAGVGHLLANAACIGYFGPRVEFALGPMRYAGYLATCIAVGGLCQAGAAWAGLTPPMATVGASSAAYGLLVAGWGLRPRDTITRVSVVVYGGLALAGVLASAGGQVAAYAHLGGVATGLALLWARRRPVGC